MDAAVKEQTAEMSEANRQRNSIESAVDVPSPGIYIAQSFPMDKQHTLAEELSTQATASECFHLVEAMMSMCESYLKDNADFKGFILWALVDNNGRFEQPGGIEESRGMERNDESYHSVNFEQPGGIEESGGMERNDESYNSMIFEQPGRIKESGGMERNDKSYNYLNALHKCEFILISAHRHHHLVARPHHHLVTEKMTRQREKSYGDWHHQKVLDESFRIFC